MAFDSMRGHPLRGPLMLGRLSWPLSWAAAGCDQVLLRASAQPSSDGGRPGSPRRSPVTRTRSTSRSAMAPTTRRRSARTVTRARPPSPSTPACRATIIPRNSPTRRHVYITGFVFQSSACFSCHPTGNEADITPDEHSLKYFPITDAAHGSLACADCHQDRTTSKPFTCTSCHDHSSAEEATNHSKVAGYTYDSSSCFNCHKAPSD